MKRMMTLCLSCLSVVSAIGQGQVNFVNHVGVTFATSANRYVYVNAVGPGATNPSFPNLPGSGDPNRLTGTTFVAGLWYLAGANRDGEISTATQAGRLYNFRLPTTAEQNRGTWVVPIGASSLFTLDGVNPGGIATLQVRVWDSAKYSSFESAVAGGEFGASAPFNYTAPVAGEANPDAYYMDNLRAFAIVPEPSTIFLGILGAGSLLLLRRRR